MSSEAQGASVRSTTWLHRTLRRDFGLLVLVYLLFVPISFGISAVSPYGLRMPEKMNALKAFVTSGWVPVPSLEAWLARMATGDSVLGILWVRTAVFVLLAAVATMAAVSATFRLVRHRDLIAESTLVLLFRTSIALAVINIVVYPMCTEDMWMSIVWGRMLAAGHNPYYQYFTTEALSGTPLHWFELKMTYGPLWAWLSVAMAVVSLGSPVLMFLASKLALLACWVASLWLVRQMLRGRPRHHQAAGVAFFGWWPMSVHFTMAEGHNDIGMVALMLLWLYLARRSSTVAAVFALAASVLVKYVTAPLAAVELWRGWHLAGRARFLAAAAGAAGVAVLVVLPLAPDLKFLDSVLGMQGWGFLTPAHAVARVLQHAGVPVGVPAVTMVARGVAAVVLGAYALRYFTRREPETLEALVLATMLAVLLTGIGHVWPWFIVWVAPLAALVGAGPLWRVSVALVLLAPFLDVFWLASSGWPGLPIAGVLFFGGVGAVTLLPFGWRELAWGADDAPRVTQPAYGS